MKEAKTIVGGGISGLLAAYYLKKKNPETEVKIYEHQQWGGLIQSTWYEWGLAEWAAHSFILTKEMEELIHELGVPIVLLPKSKRYLYYAKAVYEMPKQIFQLLELKEIFILFNFILRLYVYKSSIKPRVLETLEEWSCRVLSRGIFEKLIKILCLGIYADWNLSASLVLKPLFQKKRGKRGRIFKVLAGNHFLIESLRHHLIKKGVQFIQGSRTEYDIEAKVPEAVPKKGIVSITAVFAQTERIRGFGVLCEDRDGVMGVLLNSDVSPHVLKLDMNQFSHETWLLSEHGIKLKEEELLEKISKKRSEMFQTEEQRPIHFHIQRSYLPHYSVELESYLLNHLGYRQIGNYRGVIGLSSFIQNIEQKIDKESVIISVNLGTPKKLNILSVARYLREFLMDKEVIHIPYLLRFILVHLVIIPFRSLKSLKAYEKIWKRGSPLRLNMELMEGAFKQQFPKVNFEIAYRYPKSELLNLIQKHQDKHIYLLPLYPFYASSTGKSITEILPKDISIKMIHHYFLRSGFIRFWKQAIMEACGDLNREYDVIICYHGIPEKHLNMTGCKAECDCLHPDIYQKNFCYQYQTRHFYTILKNEFLEYKQIKISMAYQSRFGKQVWLRPYLNKEFLRNKNNIILAPVSFSCDCLETEYELNIELRHEIEGEGKTLKVLKCPNEKMVEIIEECIWENEDRYVELGR